jgi:hypothetical protein
METESLGKVLPRILFPYVQQWAESSGFTLLSRLLVDEQFQGLLEKYGDEMVTLMARDTPRNGAGRGNGKASARRAEPRVSETDANVNDLTSLQDRVLALEAQQEVQQALFEALRIKIRPLALALGCCPECLVGIEGCLKCGGQSTVGHYLPDYTLLETQVVSPLVARGVPLSLNDKKISDTGRQPKTSTITGKRSLNDKKISDTGRQSRASTVTGKGSRAWPKK